MILRLDEFPSSTRRAALFWLEGAEHKRESLIKNSLALDHTPARSRILPKCARGRDRDMAAQVTVDDQRISPSYPLGNIFTFGFKSGQFVHLKHIRPTSNVDALAI